MSFPLAKVNPKDFKGWFALKCLGFVQPDKMRVRFWGAEQLETEQISEMLI